MQAYRGNRLVKYGLVLLVLGSAPLLLVILFAALGLLSDPHPNPVGPGLLFAVTFWPAVIMLGIGAVQVRRQR